MSSRMLVRRILPVALFCITLAGPVRAGSVDATIVVDKTATVNFSPGFGLNCAHDITITISDETVLCAVNPPAKSKGTKFKFKGKKPGVVNVVVEYYGTQKNCSGFASVRRNIEVTADLKTVDKDFKTSANTSKKLIKEKIKTALKIYCRNVNDTVKAFKDGQISSVDQALSDITGAGFGLALWTSGNIHKCLGDLSFSAKTELINNAIDELLPRMQLGSCDSLYDGVKDSASKGYARLGEQIDAKKAQAAKAMDKMDKTMGTDVTTWSYNAIPGLDAILGPDSGTGPSGTTMPPRLGAGFAWRSMDTNGQTVSLGYSGTVTGDPTRTDVQVDISGPNGYMVQQVHPLQLLADILGSNGLDQDLQNEGAGGLATDLLRGAEFELMLIPLSGGGGEGGLEPGSYRIDVRYPGETFPADSVFITVP